MKYKVWIEVEETDGNDHFENLTRNEVGCFDTEDEAVQFSADLEGAEEIDVTGTPMAKLAFAQIEVTELRASLGVLLDQVDYTAGACSLTSMVGAALPKEVIDKARAALSSP